MKNRLAVIVCLCSFAALTLCSAQVIESCRYAVELCLSLILPSLFPFFVLSVLLNRLGLPGYLGRLLTPPASRVYGVTGAGASALLIGLTGGYPLGAAYIADMERSGAITAREGERLLAMKLSPYSLLLFGSGALAEELFAYLLSNGYEIGSLLGGEALCDQVIAMLESRFGIRYREALAMDFMEAREVTEGSCADVEIPTEADLEELVECKTCFVKDCGLNDPVSLERTRQQLGEYRILRRDGKIVSMAGISAATPDAMKIAAVYTRPAYRGKGLARLVVNTAKNEILAQGKIATLNVDKKNPITNHLYRSLGFEPVFSQGEYRRE